MKARTKARISVFFGVTPGIFALALLSLFAGCKRSEESSIPPATSSAQKTETPAKPSAPPAAGEPYFRTSFQTESQFVLESIVTDIAEMLYFARHHALPPGQGVVVTSQENGGGPNAPAYDLTIQMGDAPAFKTNIKISGPIWSETVYAELTKDIAKSLELPSPATAPTNDVAMLERLLDGLPETIAREDLRVSTDLQNDFTNPSLHEQSAALLGAFMLRENSGLFFDIRLPLSRMTAHLALARFLAGDHPSSIAGKVADCMLLTGMNNQVAAIKEIDQLDTAQKPVAAWARTLRAINTLDFRPLDLATNVPGIEQVTWFASYSAANSRSMAWTMVGSAVQDRTDFCRVAGALGYDVGMGNMMLQVWLPLELDEEKAVYKILHDRELFKKDIVSALNTDPDRCFIPGTNSPPTVRVIGWGLWALQLQHHLCMAIHTDFKSLQYKLGVPEAAAEFAEESGGEYGKLRFYDFVRRLDCTNAATYRKSVDDGWAFTVKYPHLTPVLWMDYLCQKVPFADLYEPIPNPHCNEWTSHNPLPGTAYDASSRLNFPSFTGDRAKDVTKVRKIHELAPYDLGLCKYIGRSYGTNWTHEAADSTFGRLLPYSALAATCIADSRYAQPAEYEKLIELGAKWDPSLYCTLAGYQWDHGQTNEAMKSYEKEEELDPDAVTLSNIAGRRVAYYLATGQKQKAKSVAEFAAEVYSARGLAAKGYYLEHTGDLPGAFEWYAKIEERYRDPDELLFFCCRHASPAGDADLDKQISDRLQKWYNQRQKVALRNFSKPPANGVAVGDKVGPILEKLGMKKGDVIVAARGVRVNNITMFFLARDMDRAPDLSLIYWDGKSYKEATATLNADHLLGCDVLNYYTQ